MNKVITTTQNNKALNIIFWIAQVLLAAMFIMAGFMKITQPIETLSQSLPWTSQVPEALVRFIGISELLGGLGLILPSHLRIKPQLTVWAAIGLATVMLLAAGFHLMQGEMSVIRINIILMLIASMIDFARLTSF